MGNDELDIVRRDVELYLDVVSESWRDDHEVAMACYRFQDILQRGIMLFDLLVRVDECWRKLVSDGKVSCDPNVPQILKKLLARWSEPCPEALRRLEVFERNGFEVAFAEEFRSRCREAQGILTPDSAFFVDDALVSLRDAALDQHRRGETIEQWPA